MNTARNLSLLALMALTPIAANARVTPPPAKEPIGEFTFIHLSDTHLEPYLQMPDSLDGARSFSCIQSLAGLGPIRLAPFRETVEAPSFAVITGDVTEFGFAGVTEDVYERYYDGVTFPQFLAPGNHDNTWVANTSMFRRRFGGFNYTFEYEGVRFIALASATLQDPAPSFGYESVDFLTKTLADAGPETPVIVMFHHPLSTNEFASEYDKERVLDAVRGSNILFFLVGHYHSSRVEEFGGIPVVHGGSTFTKSGVDPYDAGYNVISFKDGQVRVVYRHCADDEAKDEMLALKVPARATYPAIEWESPKEKKTYTKATIPIDARIAFPTANLAAAEYRIDGGEPVPLQLKEGRARGTISTSELLNGAHRIRIEFRSTTGANFTRNARFHVDLADRPDEGRAKWRYQMRGASKATPLVVGNTIYVGDNAGFLNAVNAANGKLRWDFNAAGEILGKAAWYNETILFGTGNGRILALDKDGNIVWEYSAGSAVYTAPRIDEDGMVYFGTNAGTLLCLNATSGQLVWENSDADYSIESAPLITQDLVVLASWDGYVRALDRKTGESIWKALAPMNQGKDRAIRYYGAADDSPYLIGDKIYLTDRGYVLGNYNLTGQYIGPVRETVASISPSDDGSHLYIRRTKEAFSKISADGTSVWKADFSGGRIPAAPVESNGLVYTIENSGKLRVLDAQTGAALWSYRTTPDLYVMSSPAVQDGVVFTTAMDGYLTAITPPWK